MRKFFAVLLAVLLLCGLVACGGNDGDVESGALTPASSDTGESSALVRCCTRAD